MNVVASDLYVLMDEHTRLLDDMRQIVELPGPDKYGSALLIATEALERPVPKLCERLK